MMLNSSLQNTVKQLLFTRTIFLIHSIDTRDAQIKSLPIISHVKIIVEESKNHENKIP